MIGVVVAGPGVNCGILRGSKKLVSTKDARLDVMSDSGGLLIALGVGRRDISRRSFSAELGLLFAAALGGVWSFSGGDNCVREPARL